MGIILAAHVAQAASGIAEPWGAIFSGERAVFHILPETPAAGWSLALSGAVVARGEGSSIDYTFPSLREGVVVAGGVDVHTSADVLSKPIWLFSRKPGFPALDNLHIFDPIGKTAPLLESNGLPCRPIFTVNNLADITNGIVIVGAGISIDETKEVAPAVFAAAARGEHILWLTPAGGHMNLPGEDSPAKPAMDFKGVDVVTKWDKRFHPEDWRATPAVEAAFCLVGDRRVVEMEWSVAGTGWCWLDARWPSGGRLVISGLSVIAAWEDNPAPRYLLAEWLFDLNKTE